VEAFAIGDDGPKIKSLKKTGATLPMGSSKSGGNKNSGSKSKGSKGAGKVKASDAVERYKEIND
jgi:hypothetical protein